MLLKTRLLTKWSHVFRRNSYSTSSTTSDKVRQVIGCGTPTAIQLQFSYKIWQCERNQRGFNLYLMCIGWMRIQNQVNVNLICIQCERASVKCVHAKFGVFFVKELPHMQTLLFGKSNVCMCLLYTYVNCIVVKLWNRWNFWNYPYIL